MKEFFLILFFSKVVALTPQPVDILGTLEIRPVEPLKAITSGASIEIEVSHLLGDVEGIVEREHKIKELFPAWTIKAELHSSRHKPIALHYEGNFAWSNESTWLILSGVPGLPTGVEFDKVVVKSQIRLAGVRVSWKNYSK